MSSTGQIITDCSGIKNQYINSYKFHTFIPSENVGNSSTFINTIIPLEEGITKPVVNMEQMPGLHTKETCQLNAALKLSREKLEEERRMKTGEIIEKPGLEFRVFDGFFRHSPNFFVLNKPTKIGNTTKFNNISAATNNEIAENNTNPYSVEWFGYINPDESGSWTFQINTNKAAFFWIGDKALSGYSQYIADIQKKMYVNYGRNSKSINLEKGKRYPIRIQFANNHSIVPNFEFVINSPSGNTNKTNTLYSLYDKNGKNYEIKQIYYSLTYGGDPKSVDPKRFNCNISNVNNTTVNDSIKKYNIDLLHLQGFVSNTKQVKIWSLFDENTESNMINPGNIGKFDDKGFSIYSSNGTFLKTVMEKKNPWYNEITDKTIKDTVIKNYVTGEYSFYLPENFFNDVSLLLAKKETDISGNDKIYVSSRIFLKNDGYVANQAWKNEKDSGIGAFSINNETIMDQNTRIYSNGFRYKLSLEDGNLSIYAATAADYVIKDSKGNEIKYSTNSSVQSLYNVSADGKLNNTFYVNDADKELTYVNPNIDGILGNGITYTKIGDYEPINKNNDMKVKNVDECLQKCNSDPTCNYFYNYTTQTVNDTQPTNFCSLVKDKQFPILQPVQKAMQGQLKIKTSELYVRDKKIIMDQKYIPQVYNDQGERIETIKLSSGKDLLAYSEYKWKNVDLANNEPIGFISNETYKTKCQFPMEKNINAFTNISGSPPSYRTFGKEPYVNLSNSQFNIENCNEDAACRSYVESQKMDPLRRNANYLYSSINSVQNNENQIHNTISQYNDLYVDLSNNIYSDFNNEYPELIDPSRRHQKTIVHQLKRDVNEMVEQENQLFILGGIATATLLIISIFMVTPR